MTDEPKKLNNYVIPEEGSLLFGKQPKKETDVGPIYKQTYICNKCDYEWSNVYLGVRDFIVPIYRDHCDSCNVEKIKKLKKGKNNGR